MPQAHRLQQLDAGDRGGARAVHHHVDRFQVAPGEVERVQERRGGDDRRAVLIVMEDRDIQELAQPLLDDEAFGRLDVLEVDAAEGGVQVAHAIDELVDILGVDLEIDTVDAGKALEQHRLAFHDGLGGERAEVAQAEHRRAVRDHRDEIALGGIVIGERRVALDVEARKGDAGRIGERQVVRRRQRLGRRDLELAGTAFGVELEGFLFGDAAIGLIDGRQGAFLMLAGGSDGSLGSSIGAISVESDALPVKAAPHEDTASRGAHRAGARPTAPRARATRRPRTR